MIDRSAFNEGVNFVVRCAVGILAILLIVNAGLLLLEGLLPSRAYGATSRATEPALTATQTAKEAQGEKPR